MKSDTYTLRYHSEEWECGDKCCYDCRDWYTVEYEDCYPEEFDSKAEALMFILQLEGIKVDEEDE